MGPGKPKAARYLLAGRIGQIRRQPQKVQHQILSELNQLTMYIPNEIKAISKPQASKRMYMFSLAVMYP
jgi:hypothetical protein